MTCVNWSVGKTKCTIPLVAMTWVNWSVCKTNDLVAAAMRIVNYVSPKFGCISVGLSCRMIVFGVCPRVCVTYFDQYCGVDWCTITNECTLFIAVLVLRVPKMGNPCIECLYQVDMAWFSIWQLPMDTVAVGLDLEYLNFTWSQAHSMFQEFGC